jgi:hypothetical protein
MVRGSFREAKIRQMLRVSGKAEIWQQVRRHGKTQTGKCQRFHQTRV